MFNQFWLDDRYFDNPQNLARRLTQLNREVKRIDWDARRVERTSGPLRDDTTLLVIRRKRAVAAQEVACENHQST